MLPSSGALEVSHYSDTHCSTCLLNSVFLHVQHLEGIWLEAHQAGLQVLQLALGGLSAADTASNKHGHWELLPVMQGRHQQGSAGP